MMTALCPCDRFLAAKARCTITYKIYNHTQAGTNIMYIYVLHVQDDRLTTNCLESSTNGIKQFAVYRPTDMTTPDQRIGTM